MGKNMNAGWTVWGVVGILFWTAGVVRAEVTWHNGSDDPLKSFPLGDGDVDVGLIATDDFTFVEKDFYESATHELTYDFVSGQPPVSFINEIVFNVTAAPDSWTAFTITLELATFFKNGEGGTGTPLEGDITIDDIDLRHALSGDPFEDSELAQPISVTLAGGVTTLFIDFADPLAVNDGFTLLYDIGVNCTGGSPCGDGFVMTETPTPFAPIPAPGAALLAALGFGCVGWVRRREA